jgi:hypothetical protein
MIILSVIDVKRINLILEYYNIGSGLFTYKEKCIIISDCFLKKNAIEKVDNFSRACLMLKLHFKNWNTMNDEYFDIRYVIEQRSSLVYLQIIIELKEKK